MQIDLIVIINVLWGIIEGMQSDIFVYIWDTLEDIIMFVINIKKNQI